MVSRPLLLSTIKASNSCFVQRRVGFSPGDFVSPPFFFISPPLFFDAGAGGLFCGIGFAAVSDLWDSSSNGSSIAPSSLAWFLHPSVTELDGDSVRGEDAVGVGCAAGGGAMEAVTTQDGSTRCSGHRVRAHATATPSSNLPRAAPCTSSSWSVRRPIAAWSKLLRVSRDGRLESRSLLGTEAEALSSFSLPSPSEPLPGPG
mmetsp:Transcript_49395/g.106352  ORF Transcript_49395/g.106352 Transcript_49395/m.106352 type:complete len:202 (+) Transcript_49395:643-1248(+)